MNMSSNSLARMEIIFVTWNEMVKKIGSMPPEEREKEVVIFGFSDKTNSVRNYVGLDVTPSIDEEDKDFSIDINLDYWWE